MNKKVFVSIFALMLILSLMLLPNLRAQEEPEQPRTYYETLDLSSPEAAVTTFVEAFQRDDYFTVYLVFDYQAQVFFIQYFRLADYGKLFKPEYQEQIIDSTGFWSEPLPEHVPDGPALFDAIMVGATQHDAFLIDLHHDVMIVEVQEFEVVVQHSGENFNIPAADVHTRVKDTGEVIFRTVQAPSGRWRVRQVSLPNANQHLEIWAVEVPSVTTEIIEASVNWYTPCEGAPNIEEQLNETEPYLIITPNCGEIGIRQTEHGSERTRVQLYGANFEPHVSAQIIVRHGSVGGLQVHEYQGIVSAMPDENGEFTEEFLMPFFAIPYIPGNTTQFILTVRQEIPPE